MVLIIPLIAAIMAVGGVGTLFWYNTLSDAKKKEYDRKVLNIFKSNMEERFSITFNDGDNLVQLKEKAKEKGISEKDVKTVIKEAQNEAKEELKN